MVLTVLFEDVDVALLQKGVATNTWSIGRPTYGLENADAALLISVAIPQMKSILRALEEQAKLYGTHLNQTKTEILDDARKPARARSVSKMGLRSRPQRTLSIWEVWLAGRSPLRLHSETERL